MKTTVIVTTYNRPDALKLVLAGLAAQMDAEFELLVADDGSTVETAQVIREFCGIAPFPVRHVRQEDDGFRAAAIRNQAVLETDADYLVFTDGDCVPMPNFVAAHCRLAEQGCFLAGNRILLNEVITTRVLAAQTPIYEWSRADWRAAKHSGDVNRLSPLYELALPGWLRKIRPQRWQGAKTCNLSLWREDFVRVNGFDERYCGWGLEDSDLVIRLIRAGLRHKTARFAAPVAHLWHREFDRAGLPENQARLASLLMASGTRAVVGLDNYAVEMVPRGSV